MARSLKKGTICRCTSVKESRRYECSRTEAGNQDLVPSFKAIFPSDGWSHNRCT